MSDNPLGSISRNVLKLRINSTTGLKDKPLDDLTTHLYQVATRLIVDSPKMKKYLSEFDISTKLSILGESAKYLSNNNIYNSSTMHWKDSIATEVLSDNITKQHTDDISVMFSLYSENYYLLDFAGP